MDVYIGSLLIILMTTIVGFITSWFWFNRRVKENAKNKKILEDTLIREKVVELEKKFSLLESAMVPISSAYQAILIKELTHMHTPEMDVLLEKLGPPNILTDEEEAELAEALRKRAIDMGDKISASERDAAIILPYVVKRAKAEAEIFKDEPNLLSGLINVYSKKEKKKEECDE